MSRDSFPTAYAVGHILGAVRATRLFGGGVTEGAEDVREGEDAFEFAEIGAVDDGQDRPIAGPAQDFFESLVGENHRERALGFDVGCGERLIDAGSGCVTGNA